jgi:hypothetical protein
MKRAHFISSLLLSLSCTSYDANWDTGAQRQEATQEESRQSIDENARDQFPSPLPNTNAPQPF